MSLHQAAPSHVSALPQCGKSAARGNAYRAVDALERLAEFLSLHKDGVTADHALGVAVARGEKKE